ncbi:hypothetical protein LJC37_05055 [Bacteroidales bacterium OttesenSCG-928-E04]|nr:hypothetical protein [Bacteroidales bacterium OttesenSCG-928-E04]
MEGDTFNKYDASGEKNGPWLIYIINPNMVTFYISGNDGTREFESRKYFTTDSILYPWEILVTERQFYKNGEKDGIWYGYYFDGTVKYEAWFEHNHLEKLFYFSSKEKKILATIEKREIDGSYFLKRENSHGTENLDEADLLKLFGWE